MPALPPIYLTLKGVPVDAPPSDDEPYFWSDFQGAWRPSSFDLSSEIECDCILIHDGLAAAIFGDLQTFHALLPYAPDLIFTAGLNSECNMPRSAFERFVEQNASAEPFNKLMYLADCRKLVASIQECTKEVSYLLGEFYRALNLDSLFFPPMDEPDGTRWMTSPVVTNIHATLSFIFIRLHSLLDYTTKLAYEAQHLRSDFTSYPRLASKNILFGDRKFLNLNKAHHTLFESCDVVTEVELYRNHIIHAGLLDDMPKVYKVVEGGRTVEKFVLLPDRGPSGQFDKFRGRSLFYSGEDRVNLRLPYLIKAFQERQVATLQGILGLLKNTDFKGPEAG
jgi:hypothetical protein